MKKHLSETLAAVTLTLVLSTVGIAATHAQVNSTHDNIGNNANNVAQEANFSTLTRENETPITAAKAPISFTSTNVSSTITADAKSKISFSSVSVTSIPKPKPVVVAPKPVELPVETPVETPDESTAASINDAANPLANANSGNNAPVAPAPAKVNLPQNMNAYQAYAGAELKRRGMGDAELTCLIPLWNKESGWNPNAANPSSSARGIPQMMMGIHYGLDWATNARGVEYLTNPEVQINVGLDYIQGRYQTPCNALNIWNTQSWY